MIMISILYIIFGFFAANIIMYLNNSMYKCYSDNELAINFIVLWIIWLPLLMWYGFRIMIRKIVFDV